MVQRLREYFIDCVPARRSSVSFLYVDIDEDAPPLDACSPLKSDEVILLRRPTSSADITHSNELGNPSSRSFTEEINSQVINTSFVPPRIGSLISSIMQPDSRLNDVLGTFARGDKNVFVIGSFVGTTGSALILALPRLIRNICRGNTPHVGAIVLPPPAFGFPE